MHLAVCVGPFMDFLRTGTRTNQAKKCGKEKRQCKRVKPVHKMLSTSDCEIRTTANTAGTAGKSASGR
ncbi:hypothetical protein, partial [Massilia pseudoviolaceinigra]|uniref:hypothetical protein n=1 Tax=Massilia pseudoviolaceinigra TaxID=3057165 RepID=UPI002796B6F8